ncbi:MAG TPA: MFS transporter [Bacteroidales bacterium]|nr:MFS transporter [Bacteroidales bacterium]
MKSRTITFISVFVGIFLFGVSMVMIGSVLPLLKTRLGLTDIVAGELFSILPLGLLIGSVYFGPVSDKYGYRWVLATASLFLAIGFVGIGHSMSLWLLRVCILFFGIGGGVINGASSALISDLSSDDKKIANLNLLGVFFGLGALSMPIVLSMFSESFYITVINIVALVSVLVMLLFLSISYPIAVEKEKISLKLIHRFFKNKVFLIICFFLFFQSAFEAIMNNWSVSYFTEHLQVSQKQALTALSFLVLGMTTMRAFSGGVFRKLSSKHLLLMAFSFLSVGAFCLYIQQPWSYYLNIFGLFLIGAGLSPGFPVMLGVVGNMYKEISGTAFSFAMLVALSGNMIINYAAGTLIEIYGERSFIYVIIAQIAAMIALYIFIRKDNKSFS